MTDPETKKTKEKLKLDDFTEQAKTDRYENSN